MVGNQSFGHGEMLAALWSAGSWPPAHLQQGGASRPHPWLAIGIAATATVTVAELAAALVRPTDAYSSATTTTPTHGPADVAAAHQELRVSYKSAARAVQVDTNGSQPAFARIALTSPAALLYNASTDPVLDEQHPSGRQALATALLTDTAKSSERVATDTEFRDAVADVNAQDAATKKVCGVG